MTRQVPMFSFEENITNKSIKSSMLVGVSIIHLAVSLGSIGVSTFIPAQLAIIGWETTIIAFIIGIGTLFELSRFFIGYLGDNFAIFGSYRRSYVVIGLITQTFGLLIISQLLGSYLIIIGIIFFVIGSATVSTLSDAFLLDNAFEKDQGKIAGTTQFFRLSGFAVGGILGALIYDQLKFDGFFIILAVIGLIIGFISISNIKEIKILEDEGNPTAQKFTFTDLFDSIKKYILNKRVLLMGLFLVFFLIGLFAQDAVLEPYAVRVFMFSEENIGKLAAVWGVTTLIFIPLALLLDKKIKKIIISVIGLIIAAVGLLTIGYLGLELQSKSNLGSISNYQNLLLLFVAIFGAGLGLVTTPSTSIMLDVCNRSGSKTLLLAYFGLITTIGRSIASFFAGFIMEIGSFPLLFFIEALILFLSFIPLYWVNNDLK